LIRNLLYRISQKYKRWLASGFVLNAASSARISIHQNAVKIGRISVGENSELFIEEGFNFNGTITIGNNCNVRIGKNCDIKNALFTIIDGSKVTIGNDCFFDAPAHTPNYINVEDKGTFILADNVRIQSDILVRFGGVLSFGTYSFINWGSEIRCEEKVTIGEYTIMSYEVCIYDTNTHSVDWAERRLTIPNRADEKERPSTKPIVIGDDVWVGKGATILKGVSIGNKSIVGIRTVVPTGIYAEGSIIVTPKPFVLNK
jgi:acetyltransferase-like isoleucine patch superfamily enzyme